MSWLLVALIPGLLMLVTFGLERVESSLCKDTLSATDVAEFLDQAEASDVDMLARDGMGSALHSLHRRRGAREAATGGLTEYIPVPSLPTRHSSPHSANTEFHQTRHANPV